MTDRPILFSGPMIRALLDGRKTQTRRVITKKAVHNALAIFGADFLLLPGNMDLIGYAPGDQLWVREAHSLVPASAYRCSEGVSQSIDPADPDCACVYREGWDRSAPPWRPSIHMPRCASRLTLTVTEVRVQRLQEITLGDICAEGLAQSIYDFRPVQCGFDAWQDLWDSLNADRAPWASNPWVVALSFTVKRGNIDQTREAA